MQMYDDPNAPKPDPRRRFLCRHIFPDGHRCGSPALRGGHLCFYHRTTRAQPPISIGNTVETATFEMPRIEDRTGIQLALYHVLARIAGNDIDSKRAGLLLYGLQIASGNLPRQPQPAVQELETRPLVEEVFYNIQLGDLAPIQEIPEDPTASPLAEPERSEAPASASPEAPASASHPERTSKLPPTSAPGVHTPDLLHSPAPIFRSVSPARESTLLC